jgi:hypothetical protein
LLFHDQDLEKKYTVLELRHYIERHSRVKCLVKWRKPDLIAKALVIFAAEPAAVAAVVQYPENGMVIEVPVIDPNDMELELETIDEPAIDLPAADHVIDEEDVVDDEREMSADELEAYLAPHEHNEHNEYLRADEGDDDYNAAAAAAAADDDDDDDDGDDDGY